MGDELSTPQYRVLAEMGIGCMGALAGDLNVKGVCRGARFSQIDTHRAKWYEGSYVGRHYSINVWVLENSVGDHLSGAVSTFFSRLENKLDLATYKAGQFRRRCQHPGSA
jgi:hypothetical protein